MAGAAQARGESSSSCLSCEDLPCIDCHTPGPSFNVVAGWSPTRRVVDSFEAAPLLHRGMLRSTRNDSTFDLFKCPRPGTCAGLMANQSMRAPNLCANHTHGQLCAVCDDGSFGKPGRQCALCDGSWATVGLQLLAVMLLAALLRALWRSQRCAPHVLRLLTASSDLLAVAKILIGALLGEACIWIGFIPLEA